MADSLNQITIPDFEDDFSSSSIPFGRPSAFSASANNNPFSATSAAFGASSSTYSILDSPTHSTADRTERSYFHSRGDSVTSEDSSYSIQLQYHQVPSSSSSLPQQQQPPQQQQQQPSKPASFARKPSFASIRNAFKSSSKSSSASNATDAPPPPVPPYPVLKNPFNKSTTSLSDKQDKRRPSLSVGIGASPPQGQGQGQSVQGQGFGRPPTPSTSEYKRRPSHTHRFRGRSQHSQTSVFHHSDGGSDSGFNFGFGGSGGGIPGTPPVPRVPEGVRSGTPVDVDDRERERDREPKTPAEFALNAVLVRFVAIAESLIDNYLKLPLDREHPLTQHFSSPKLDDILHSFGQIALRSDKAVIDAIWKWKRSQREMYDGPVLQQHLNEPFAAVGGSSRGLGSNSSAIISTLNERKALAVAHITCHAFITTLDTLSGSSSSTSNTSTNVFTAHNNSSASREALGETTGYKLEEIVFEQFKRPDLKMLAQSANYKTNAELYARLVGCLANLRFVSITDRFLAELSPNPSTLPKTPKDPLSSSAGPSTPASKSAHKDKDKDTDTRQELLVRGLRYIKLKVWPPESFEEGAEFVEGIAKAFESAHGLKLKTAYAEILVLLMHPIGKTAQAEVNHPVWAKAIESIYPRALQMMNKPRYWSVAYPLVITALCVAPHQFFLKHWLACVDAGVGKLKEKPFRTTVMNGMMRLIWTYLYRCQEPSSTTASKLDTVLKHFFPPGRTTLHPSEEPLDIFVYIVHFIVSRHPDVGMEVVLGLMQEASLKTSTGSGIGGGAILLASSHISPERTNIALEATLLSLHLFERGDTPAANHTHNKPFSANAATPTTSQSSVPPIPPSWPSNADFSILPTKDDYPSSSDANLEAFINRTGVKTFWERASWVVCTVAGAAFEKAGCMSLFDESWHVGGKGNGASFPPSSLSGSTGGDDPQLQLQTSSYVVRQHPECNTAYPSSLTPTIALLHMCYTSWPRMLNEKWIKLEDMVDMLLAGLVHVEPAIGDAAKGAIGRIVAGSLPPPVSQTHTTGLHSAGHPALNSAVLDITSKEASGKDGEYEPGNEHVVLSRFANFLFGAKRVDEFPGTRLNAECVRVVGLWAQLVDSWVSNQAQRTGTSTGEAMGSGSEDRLREIQVAVVILLSFCSRLVRVQACKVVRRVMSLVKDDFDQYRALHLLVGRGLARTSLDLSGDVLDPLLKPRLLQWKQQFSTQDPDGGNAPSNIGDVLLRIAESPDERDRELWTHIYPSFLRSADLDSQILLTPCREFWTAAISKYHPLVASISGINNKPSNSRSANTSSSSREREREKAVIKENHAMIEQWRTWTKMVCSTALTFSTPDRSSPGHQGQNIVKHLPHSRTPSVSDQAERDRLNSTTRGLFRYLTPFLDSDHNVFRETAVRCIASFPSSAYCQLLDDLGAFAARHFYDSKLISATSKRTRRQDRLYLAVTHIYALTSHYLSYQRGTARQDTLINVLKFIRHTQSFLSLPENRDDWQLQRLRRYFCGVVENLFDGLKELKSSERFIPPNMHLTLYRLVEEWCQCGHQSSVVKQRLVVMQTAATASASGSGPGSGSMLVDKKAQAIEMFQNETKLLSQAAVRAMAVLCQKAYFPPETSSGSPTDRPVDDFVVPLESGPLIDRIVAMLASISEVAINGGKKALRSLLAARRSSAHLTRDVSLVDEALRRALVTSKETETSNVRFFSVVADVVTTCEWDSHPFEASHVIFLGLVNLCSPLLCTRREAVDMLGMVCKHGREPNHGDRGVADEGVFHGGGRTLSQFEVSVRSSSPHMYLRAQHQISNFLAKKFPENAVALLTHVSTRLPAVSQESGGLAGHAIARVLASLVPWLSPHLRIQSHTPHPQVNDTSPQGSTSSAGNMSIKHACPTDLMTPDQSSFSTTGPQILYHMMAITLQYSDAHPEQVQMLWTALIQSRQHVTASLPDNGADPDVTNVVQRTEDLNPNANGLATIRFLLEQSSKIGSPGFVSCAQKIVSCLSLNPYSMSTATSGSRNCRQPLQLFSELCAMIDPNRMLPNIDHKLTFPDAGETELWSDLDALFAEQPRLSLGIGQFALLVLKDVVVDDQATYRKELAVLLHAVFVHLDHRNSFVRESARGMFWSVLRRWMAYFDEGSDDTYVAFKTSLDALESDESSPFWSEDDPILTILQKMKSLCTTVTAWLVPMHDTLVDEWGTLSLQWGTACPIRSLAFRSLQLFRSLSLMPSNNSCISQQGIALLLGRLSTTIAGNDPNIQSFTAEIILSLQSLVQSDALDQSFLPTLFWCAYASLFTPIEKEFVRIAEFFDFLLTRLDLDDQYTIQILLSHKPADWTEDSIGLQPLLLTGLRSSRTYSTTVKLLRRLAKLNDSTFIDPLGPQNRVRDMYTLILPLCLRAMEDKETVQSEEIESTVEYANDVARLAEEANLPNITRIMISFAKSRFRTKDDFLRQAVSALREYYGGGLGHGPSSSTPGLSSWIEILTTLLGFLLNRTHPLRLKTLQVLKILFQYRETRTQIDRYGSELLMPLLRLLQTDLASLALEVLQEPTNSTATGGAGGGFSFGGRGGRALGSQSHSQGLVVSRPSEDSIAEIFGVPEETGWCIAQPYLKGKKCVANVVAVFDTCKAPTRPSRIIFEPELDGFSAVPAESSDHSTLNGRTKAVEHRRVTNTANIGVGVERDSRNSDILDAELGNLVQNLHELSTFFQSEESHDQDYGHDQTSELGHDHDISSTYEHQRTIPPLSLNQTHANYPYNVYNHHLEARVAAVLANSTETLASSLMDFGSTHTPYVDVFEIDGGLGGDVISSISGAQTGSRLRLMLQNFEGSDEDIDQEDGDDSDLSDFDVDMFEFDSYATPQNHVQGGRGKTTNGHGHGNENGGDRGGGDEPMSISRRALNGFRMQRRGTDVERDRL